MAIKSLEDLRKIKAEAKKQTETRKLNEKQVIIGMGTCGIAAGARAVMTAVLEDSRSATFTMWRSFRPAASACARRSPFST